MSERVDDSSDIPTVKEVIDELGIFERWYPLGTHLKLVHPVLKAITRDEHDTEMCCITMVEKWLDSKTNPSWGELCKALQDMEEHALADRIARKYCPEMCTIYHQLKPAIPCEQQSYASNDPLVECQLPLVPEDNDDASKKQPFDTEVEFAFMFATVVRLLGETADVETLKTFLESLCDSKNHLPYVNPKLFEHCNTTTQVLKSLRPQLINSMHLYLLKKIVDKFGCDKAKELVKQYDTNFPRKVPLKRLGDPLTDEEIEACIDTKKLKVVIDGDPNGVTKRDIEGYQIILDKTTGIPREVIVYTNYTTGSIVLNFLIPEGTAEIFTNLTRNDLLFLAGSGVIRIELDGHVVDILNNFREEMRQELVPFLSETSFISSSPLESIFISSYYHPPRSVPVFRSDPPFVHRPPRSVPVGRSDPSHQTRTGPDSGYSSGVGSKTSSAVALFSENSSWSEAEEKVFKQLRSNWTKDKLEFDHMCVSDQGITMIAGALHVNCSVKELTLSLNDGMSDEGIGVLAGCLHVNQTLEKLNLHATRLSDRGVVALADGLCNNRGLRHLVLSLNHGMSDEGIGVLTGCLHVNQTLEKLNLSDTRLSDRGVVALADGLCNNRGLRELDLSGNRGITDKGVGVLAGCLRVNQTLEKLNLSDTRLSDRGMVALADGLRNNRGLRHLVLSANRRMSDEGIGVLTGCLRVNQTLEKLDLSDTRLSDRGMAALADGLRNNRGLRELNLRHTSLSDKGVAALADGLCNNRGLRELKLPRNVSVGMRRWLEDIAREKEELTIHFW